MTRGSRTLIAGLTVTLWAACSAAPPTKGPTEVQPEPPRPQPQSECVVRRASFDIGSATTKIKVADVNLCTKQMVRVLLADDAPVFYRDDLSGRPEGEGRLARGTMDRGIETLRRFKDRAARFEPAGYAAVATSAIRKAANGEDFVERIRAETGIIARVISQGEEAELGFLGSVAALGVDPRLALVWDVGGQSMQLTIMTDDGGLRVHQSQLASGQMRDHVMRQLQHKDEAATTPNPISPEVAAAARVFAADFARREIPEDVQARLRDPSTVVIGIGALKYYGQAAPDRALRCNLDLLEQRLDALVGLDDDEIGGAYASTQVTDRLLIVGFMEALGIESMQLANIDLSDGLLFHADYWKPPEGRQPTRRERLPTRGRVDAKPGPAAPARSAAARSARLQRGSSSQRGS